MSLEYVEKRIREALRLSRGNTLQARKIITGWCQEDPKLLQSMTKPHLSGIVAYNIDRVASGRSTRAREKIKSPSSKTPQTPKKKTEDNFGRDLLKAVAAAGAAEFGFDHGRPSPKRGQASQQHINAIHQMASRSKTKKL